MTPECTAAGNYMTNYTERQIDVLERSDVRSYVRSDPRSDER